MQFVFYVLFYLFIYFFRIALQELKKKLRQLLVISIKSSS